MYETPTPNKHRTVRHMVIMILSLLTATIGAWNLYTLFPPLGAIVMLAFGIIAVRSLKIVLQAKSGQ